MSKHKKLSRKLFTKINLLLGGFAILLVIAFAFMTNFIISTGNNDFSKNLSTKISPELKIHSLSAKLPNAGKVVAASCGAAGTTYGDGSEHDCLPGRFTTCEADPYKYTCRSSNAGAYLTPTTHLCYINWFYAAAGFCTTGPTLGVYCTYPADKTLDPLCQTATSSVTASISVNPATIKQGEGTIMTWGSSSNATSCILAPGNLNVVVATSGRSQFFPNKTTTYAVKCLNSTNESNIESATVTVTTPNPNATINSDKTVINQGESALLTWTSKDANICTVSNIPSTDGVKTAGTYAVRPTTTTTYVLDCYDYLVHEFKDSVTIIVNTTPDANKPTINLTADPTSIFPGEMVSLNYTSSNASSCTLGSNGSGSSVPPNVSRTARSNPTITTNYTYTCTNAGGSVSQSVTVIVNAGKEACANGAIDSPECKTCSNGGLEPTCKVCGAADKLVNGQCVPKVCSNGANSDINGICPTTSRDTCDNGYQRVNGQCPITIGCANGAINPPNCNQCGVGKTFVNGICQNDDGTSVIESCKTKCNVLNVCGQNISGYNCGSGCNIGTGSTGMNQSCIIDFKPSTQSVNANGSVEFSWKLPALPNNVGTRCGFVDLTTPTPRAIPGLQNLDTATDRIRISNIQTTTRFCLICQFYNLINNSALGDAAVHQWVRVIRIGEN